MGWKDYSTGEIATQVCRLAGFIIAGLMFFTIIYLVVAP
jgi:hypothetical protein